MIQEAVFPPNYTYYHQINFKDNWEEKNILFYSDT